MKITEYIELIPLRKKCVIDEICKYLSERLLWSEIQNCRQKLRCWLLEKIRSNERARMFWWMKGKIEEK